jgi:hypothetical protein
VTPYAWISYLLLFLKTFLRKYFVGIVYYVDENVKYVEKHVFHYCKTKIKGFESDDMNMH